MLQLLFVEIASCPKATPDLGRKTSSDYGYSILGYLSNWAIGMLDATGAQEGNRTADLRIKGALVQGMANS